LGHWPSYIVIGFTGSLLAASRAHWAWIDVARDVARHVMLAPMALAAGGALFLGATLAAVWHRKMRLRWPTRRRLARDFAGGAMMMTGGLMIPGGNDSLVLYGLPGASPKALVAWLLMFGALFLSFRVQGYRAGAAALAEH
jgi:toxin CptA